MRVVMRTVVDVKNCGDIETLGFWEKIYVGVVRAWTERDKYLERQAKKEAEKERALNEEKDKLKESLLITLHETFNRSPNPGEVVQQVTISVSREFEDILPDVLHSKEFLGFKKLVYKENPDMLLLFPNLPIQVEFTKEVIKNEENISIS